MCVKAIIVSAAGMAAGLSVAQSQPNIQSLGFSGNVHRAVKVRAITALTTDGQYIYGPTIALPKRTVERIPGAPYAYDAAVMIDTDMDGEDCDPVCGDITGGLTGPRDRWFHGLEHSIQVVSEDYFPKEGAGGDIIDEIAFAGVRPLCDSGTGTTSEVLEVVFESWECIDNFPDFDGSDGFNPDGNGLVSPFSLSDTDGDTFIDCFLGGLVMTFADTDTDGDTVSDEMLSFGALGYEVFCVDGLAPFGVPLTSNLDVFDGGKPGIDGRPDGGFSIRWTRGVMPGGMLRGSYAPATRAQFMLWGTASADASGCANGHGVGQGSTDGIVWAEGVELCGDGAGDWSGGGLDPNINELHDPLWDMNDLFGLAPSPAPLAWMVRLDSVNCRPALRDCCDVNDDGVCTPADFSAWLAAYAAGAPACDVNQDGQCTPADFSAWLAAFSGPTQMCVYGYCG